MIKEFLLLAAMGSAGAGDAVVQKSRDCLNTMPQVDRSSWEVVIDVQFDDRGRVAEADAVSYLPNDEIGEQAVRDVLRALQRCAPYLDVKGQTIRLNYAPQPADEIDPFKKS